MDLQQQKLLDCFIADTKEYIDIIQEAFVKLSSHPKSSEDRTSIENIFRASFAIKGGASMLGFSSIQKAVYTLEKYTKIFRDYPIQVDQYLEICLLQVCKSLKETLLRLEIPLNSNIFNNEDTAAPFIANLDPVLQEIDFYLEVLILESEANNSTDYL
jgi:type IV pili sensor histidine kinase/response regulator